MLDRRSLQKKVRAAQEKKKRERQTKQGAELQKERNRAKEFVARLKRTLTKKITAAADRGDTSFTVFRLVRDMAFVNLVRDELETYCRKRGLGIKASSLEPVGGDPILPYTSYSLVITWE